MGPAGEGSDDEIDPFDAMMGIEAEEFAQLLRDAPTDAEDAKSPAGPTLRRGGVPVVSEDDLTPESFRRDFLVPRRPVILVDPRRGVDTGYANLTPDKLREAFGDEVVPLDVTDRHERAEVRLGDFLDAVQEKDAAAESTSERHATSSSVSGTDAVASSAVCRDDGSNAPGGARPAATFARKMSPSELRRKYLRNLQLHDWFPALTPRLSPILAPNLLRDETAVPRCPTAWRDWFELFVSHPECPGFPFLHRDACHVHAAATQIVGVKRWLLFPPETAPFLYAAGPTATRSSIKREFLETLFEPAIPLRTIHAYPLLAHVGGSRIVCDVGPHETIVVPADWWHAARAADVFAAAASRRDELETRGRDESRACVSVAASFVDASAVDAFNDAYGEFEATKALLKVGAGGIR